MSSDLTPIIPVIQQAQSDLLAYATQVAQLQATNQSLMAQLQTAQGQLSDATKATAAAIAAVAKASNLLVPPNTDLATLFPSATKRYGMPGVAYQYNNSATAVIQSGGFAGANNSIALKPVSGGSTAVRIDGDGAEFSGAALAGPAVGFLITGIDPAKRIIQPRGFDLHHLSFDGSLSRGMDLEQWADSTRVTDCAFGMIGGDSIYSTADDTQIVRCSFASSQGEHNVRFDTNAVTGHRPARALIVQSDFRNALNPQKKENLAIRELDGGTFIACTFDVWVRVGQITTDTASHARNIIFVGCNWLNLRPGGALLQVEHDADVTMIGCSMPASLTDPGVVVGPRSKLMLVNCVQRVPAGMTVPKAFAMKSDPSATILGLETMQTIAA